MNISEFRDFLLHEGYVECRLPKQRNELMFIITSKESSRDYYFLYELVDGSFKKLGRARSPKELEEKYDVDKRIGVVR